MTTRIVLVRHGETEFNADGRLQGQLDIPLSSVGIAQAEAVAPVIAGMDPVAIVSSPLVRARVTAETIGRATGLEVGFDDRLKEVDVGQWAGETVPDLHRNDPHYTRLMASGEDFRRSDGETTAEVAERVTAAVRDAVDERGVAARRWVSGVPSVRWAGELLVDRAGSDWIRRGRPTRNGRSVEVADI